MDIFRQIDGHYQRAFEGLPAEAAMEQQIMLVVDTMTNYCANIFGLSALRVVYCNQITEQKSPLLLDKSRPIYQLFSHALTQGFKTGEIVCAEEKEQLVEDFVSMCRSLIFDWCLYSGGFDIQAEGRRRFTKILRIITEQ